MKSNVKKQDILEKFKGKSFSEAAMDITRRYSNRINDPIQQNSFDMEMSILENAQSVERARQEVKEQMKTFAYGGVMGGPKKTFSTVDEMPVPTQLPLDNLAFNTNPFAQPWPTHPDQINPMQVADPLNTQVGDTTQLTSNPAVTLIDSNTRVSNPSVNTRQGMSAYTPALIGQGISTALNAGLLLGGYDKEAPVTNPYTSDIKNQMANRSVDTTQQRNQILSAYNASREGLKNVRSANIQNALSANLANITQDNLAQSKLQEQQINNTYAGEYSNLLNNLGQQDVNATVLSNENTARNKGNWQSNLSALGSNVAENAKFFTTQKLNTIQNKLMGDILNTKYQEFGLNKEVVDRLSAGQTTPEDLVVLKSVYGEEAVPKLIESFKRTN